MSTAHHSTAFRSAETLVWHDVDQFQRQWTTSQTCLSISIIAHLLILPGSHPSSHHCSHGSFLFTVPPPLYHFQGRIVRLHTQSTFSFADQPSASLYIAARARMLASAAGRDKISRVVETLVIPGEQELLTAVSTPDSLPCFARSQVYFILALCGLNHLYSLWWNSVTSFRNLYVHKQFSINMYDSPFVPCSASLDTTTSGDSHTVILPNCEVGEPDICLSASSSNTTASSTLNQPLIVPAQSECSVQQPMAYNAAGYAPPHL